MENNLEKNKYAETRKAWRLANKEKMAIYARNYYHKRSSQDPEYKVMLSKKKTENNHKKSGGTVKPRGRPILYPITIDSYGLHI